MKWANMWSQQARIGFEKTKFIFQSDIRVEFDPADGVWSYIGTDCTKKFKTLNLGFVD